MYSVYSIILEALGSSPVGIDSPFITIGGFAFSLGSWFLVFFLVAFIFLIYGVVRFSRRLWRVNKRKEVDYYR